MSEAAVLADEYVLTHKDVFVQPQSSSEQSGFVSKPPILLARPISYVEGSSWSKDNTGARDKPVCFHCKKTGHTINNCFTLNKKNRPSKAVNLIKN